MILVVGGTGLLGGKIARRLLEEGRDVRTLVRPSSDSRPLRTAGAQVVAGDLLDRASLDDACAGVDVVVTTAIPRPTDSADVAVAVNLTGNRNLVDAAMAAGVAHVIYTAGYGGRVDSPVPFIAAKAKAADYLRGSGLRFTVLEPDMMMDTAVMVAVARPVMSGQTVWFAGDGQDRHSFVAAQDVASFAAAAIDRPQAWNRTLPIGGPQTLTLAEAASIFGDAVGKPIVVRGLSAEDPPSGLPPFLIPMLQAMPMYPAVPDAQSRADDLGVTLTSLAEFARSLLSHTET